MDLICRRVWFVHQDRYVRVKFTPQPIRNRAVGRAPSLPVSPTSLLWRNKTHRGGSGTLPPLTSTLWSLVSFPVVGPKPPLCRELAPSPCWAPLSVHRTPGPEVPGWKTTAPPRHHHGSTQQHWGIHVATACKIYGNLPKKKACIWLLWWPDTYFIVPKGEQKKGSALKGLIHSHLTKKTSKF